MFQLRVYLLLLAIALAIASAVRIPKPRGYFFDRILFLLVLAFMVEAWGMVSSHLGMHNTVIYNGYVVLECTTLLFMVYRSFPERRPWLWVGAGIVLAMVTFSVLANGVMDYLIIEGLIAISVVMSVISLLILWDLSRRSDVVLYKSPLFIFFVGLLLYFGGIIPVLGCWKFLSGMDRDIGQVLYLIVVVMAIVRYSSTALACDLERKRRITSDP